jgi:hypothetical protein
MPAPTAAARALPGSPSRGLLVIQVAILRDAAAQLGRIEGQMAGSRSDARAMHHHRAAVDVLEDTIGLLRAQRAALLDHLAGVAPASADPQDRCRGPAIEGAPRLVPASGA